MYLSGYRYLGPLADLTRGALADVVSQHGRGADRMMHIASYNVETCSPGRKR